MNITKLSLALGLMMCELEPGVWCVRYSDTDGGVYETRFIGQAPEARARDYYNAASPQPDHVKRRRLFRRAI
jgi:hypothetical protein